MRILIWRQVFETYRNTLTNIKIIAWYEVDPTHQILKDEINVLIDKLVVDFQ